MVDNSSTNSAHQTTLHCAKKLPQTHILLWTATVLVKDKFENYQQCRALSEQWFTNKFHNNSVH